MNNYNTRKHLFESNFKNNTINPNEFKLYHAQFEVLSQRSDDTYVYLEAKSISNSCPCKKCSKTTSAIKDKKIVYPLVGIFNSKPIIMKYTKNRYFCKNCNISFTEATPNVVPNKQLSNVIFDLIYDQLCDKSNYTKTGKLAGVSVSTVVRYLDSINLNNIRYSKVKHILIDELRLVAYSSKRKIGKFQFAVINADTGEILDILSDRSQKNVSQYLIKNFSGLSLETVTMDLWNPYKRAVANFNKVNAANVKVIADKFQFVRQLMWDLDKLRITEYDNTEKNSKEYKALKSSANILRKRFKDLSFKQITRLNKNLESTPSLYVAHKLKEEYLDIVQTCTSKQEFITHFKEWGRTLEKSKIQIERFKRTITSHINFIEEISNAFEYQYSNGFIEGLNAHMKLRKKNAYGFKNFERTVKYMKLSVGHRKMI